MFVQEKTAQEYEESYKKTYRRADALEKKLLKKLLSQWRDRKSVLEVGCGTAHFTKWLETLGFEAYGADVSEIMLKEAKKQWIPSRLVRCEGSYLPFTAKSLDIVAFITSLEFMADAEAALMEAARVAKKGVVLGLLNKYSVSTLKKKLRVATGKGSNYLNAHFYSMGDIEGMLKKSRIQYKTLSWSTTLFPKAFGEADSSVFPLGTFLGVAVTLEDERHD